MAVRMVRRLAATAVASIAFAAAAIAVATPAAASPEDGEGCAGTPAIPASYVCVISITPENIVPSTTITTVPVDVPRLCYVAGCVPAQTVNVPVPQVEPKSGTVAVLWYQGQYYPIPVGGDEVLPTALYYVNVALNFADLALDVADRVAYFVANPDELISLLVRYSQNPTMDPLLINE